MALTKAAALFSRVSCALRPGEAVLKNLSVLPQKASAKQSILHKSHFGGLLQPANGSTLSKVFRSEGAQQPVQASFTLASLQQQSTPFSRHTPVLLSHQVPGASVLLTKRFFSQDPDKKPPMIPALQKGTSKKSSGKSAGQKKTPKKLAAASERTSEKTTILVNGHRDVQRLPIMHFCADNGEKAILPWAIAHDVRAQKIEFRTLQFMSGIKSSYVELLTRDPKYWLPFHGTYDTQAFWDMLAGNGTPENPYVIRPPVAERYERRIEAFEKTPSNTEIQDIQEMQGVNREGDTVKTEEERMFYCHRPATAAALQAGLAFPGFGRVMDMLAEGPGVLTANDYRSASALAKVASKLYETEELRMQAVKDVLASMLDLPILRVFIPAVLRNKRTEFITDGSVVDSLSPTNLLYLNIEGKNEGGETYFQLIQYYRAYCVNARTNRAFFSTALPSFTVEHVGPTFRLNALWFGSHIHAEPLSPFLNVLCLEEYNTFQMQQLALTLRALKQELVQLRIFLDSNLKSGDQSLRERYIGNDLPYPFFMDLNGERTVLQEMTDIRKPHGSRAAQRIWVATMPSGKDAFVKFATSYGKAVHEAWASEGLAPEVYYCSRLPGGFWVTAMELLSPEEGWQNMGTLDATTRSEVLPTVQTKLGEAHQIRIGSSGAGGVLGDCRDQNVFLQIDKAASGPGATSVTAVKFIDFDWAGVEGVQRYPPHMSDAVMWPEGAETGQLLLQEHDRALLKSGGERPPVPGFSI